MILTSTYREAGTSPLDPDVGACRPASSGPVVGSGTYTYDKVGNPEYPGIVKMPGNHVLENDGVTLEYDAEGNVTSKTSPGFRRTHGTRWVS